MCVDWIDGRTDCSILQRPLTTASHPRLAPNRHDEVLESKSSSDRLLCPRRRRRAVKGCNHLQHPCSHQSRIWIFSLSTRIPIHDPKRTVKFPLSINASSSSHRSSSHILLSHTLAVSLLLISTLPERHSSCTHLIPAFISPTAHQIIAHIHSNATHPSIKSHPPNDGMPSWMFGVASGVDRLNSPGVAVEYRSSLGRELGVVNHATPFMLLLLGCTVLLGTYM